jgi:hypothetical protein
VTWQCYTISSGTSISDLLTFRSSILTVESQTGPLEFFKSDSTDVMEMISCWRPAPTGSSMPAMLPHIMCTPGSSYKYPRARVTVCDYQNISGLEVRWV